VNAKQIINTLEEEKISPEIISLLQSDNDGISFMFHRNVLLGGIQCVGVSHIFGSNLTLPCSISELAEWLSSQKTYIESGSFAGRNAMLNWLNKMMRKKPLANLLKKAETAREEAQASENKFLEWLEKGKPESPVEGTPAYLEQQASHYLGFWSAVARDVGGVGNWDYWASQKYLIPRDIACLMFDLDPKHFDFVSTKSRLFQPGSLADQIDEIERSATRDTEGAKLSPAKWIEWAQGKGYAVPQRFVEAVEAFAEQNPKTVSMVDQPQTKAPVVVTGNSTAGNAATRLIEDVIQKKMMNASQKVTVATIWVELGNLVGQSIIKESATDKFLCNIGEENLYPITKDSVRGVLARWRKRKMHT